LLFCSSVSPQPTAAGNLLAYRHLSLLRDWQVLAIVPSGHPIPGELIRVEELAVAGPPRWLQRCRRGFAYPYADRECARRIVQRSESKAMSFAPHTVLSVLLPDSFVTAAARFARREGLPLVLLCHDDYEAFVPASFRPYLGRIYRQADVRLCVSRPMEEEFFARYGVRGEVLPPIPSGPSVPVRPQSDGEPLIVGFAGSIGFGYEDALCRLADVLGEENGRLAVASPTPRSLVTRVWRHPAVIDLGTLPPDSVRPALLGAGVNVLAVVQSFDPAESGAFRLNFPSKLTEYTTFGLPILLMAPESASAAIWMRQNPAAGIAIHSVAVHEARNAIRQLKSVAVRRKLAQGLNEAAIGFDPHFLQQQFESALARACAGAPRREGQTALADSIPFGESRH
jgi:hypothetical protein